MYAIRSYYAYMGASFVDFGGGNQKSFANQQVNPKILNELDAFFKTPGKSSVHELTEAYVGGKTALQTRNSIAIGANLDLKYSNSMGQTIHEQAGGSHYQIKVALFGSDLDGTIQKNQSKKGVYYGTYNENGYKLV